MTEQHCPLSERAKLQKFVHRYTGQFLPYTQRLVTVGNRLTFAAIVMPQSENWIQNKVYIPF